VKKRIGNYPKTYLFTPDIFSGPKTYLFTSFSGNFGKNFPGKTRKGKEILKNAKGNWI
jgi:hypothetical protein